MVLLEKKKFKYTEITRNTDTLFEYMPYIENYCFKFQKLPLQLMKLVEFAKKSQTDFAEMKLVEFAKKSQTDFAEKCFI